MDGWICGPFAEYTHSFEELLGENFCGFSHNKRAMKSSSLCGWCGLLCSGLVWFTCLDHDLLWFFTWISFIVVRAYLSNGVTRKEWDADDYTITDFQIYLQKTSRDKQFFKHDLSFTSIYNLQEKFKFSLHKNSLCDFNWISTVSRKIKSQNTKIFWNENNSVRLMQAMDSFFRSFIKTKFISLFPETLVQSLVWSPKFLSTE